MTDSTSLNIPNLASMTNVSLSFFFQKRFILVFLAHCNLISDYCVSWTAYSSSAWIPTYIQYAPLTGATKVPPSPSSSSLYRVQAYRDNFFQVSLSCRAMRANTTTALRRADAVFSAISGGQNRGLYLRPYDLRESIHERMWRYGLISEAC